MRGTTRRDEGPRHCVTCGTELHPERAEKYAYCTARECQEQNAKGLTVVAVGVNKAADQFELLDDHTREEMASGRYHDQRRASFGRPARREPASAPAAATPKEPARPERTARPGSRPPWTSSQHRLALLYNEQGMRPDDISRKLGLSSYVVTQIILAARNRGKL